MWEFDAVRLRGIRPADLDALYAYQTDPSVRQRISGEMPTREACTDIIHALQRGIRDRTSLQWAIAERETDRLVGMCGFLWWEAATGRTEWGMSLASSHWNRGIMSQVLPRAVAYAFDVLDVSRIEATVMVGNAASARVLEKCGFRLEGTLPAHKISLGTPRDFWAYVLEWFERDP